MKLQVTVTKEILRKSMYCGQNGEEFTINNCAWEKIINETRHLKLQL